MPVCYNEETKTFHIDTDKTSMVFRVFEGGHLLSEYWGQRIRSTDLTRLFQGCSTGFTPSYAGEKYGLDLLPTEYPVYGGGDFRSPALEMEFPSGSRLLDLRYKSHKIIDGDAAFPGLPHLDGANQTLLLTLEDAPTKVCVELRYAVYEKEDIIARSAKIINSITPVRITRALSASVDLPGSRYQMIGLYGTHAHERQLDRTPIRHGTQSVESRRGASSHHHNPFIALAAPETTEDSGEVYAAALVYSGNFLAQAEAGSQNLTRLQLGINPFEFSWKLGPGESFQTPEALLTYSAEGLNRMSQNFHAAIKYRLGHAKTRNLRRPIVLNSWEAAYFDFDEEKLFSIIDGCGGLGIDMFVLDDGWFGRRDDDRTSLGDWFVYEKKLPHGLDPIIERCEQNGLKFGLWFEPEMISEKSELYAAHPDWCIGQEGRPYCFGRNQLVLDLSRREVVDYLDKTISGLLANHRISYVKWDMNRHITDAYSAALPPDRQGELLHRYMLNLYGLLEGLTGKFPDIVFEGCSGGGGRFDAGMLYYTPQIWASDNTDAIERLKIQYGTSMLYPPQSMTAHVSACPNHQMGRTTPFKTRGLVAMSASFGYELNPLTLTKAEREEIKKQTDKYKEIAPLVLDGVFYRLLSPYEHSWCAWMFVSEDKSAAFCVCVRQLSVYAQPNERVKLRGLDPAAVYHIEELDGAFNGDELMKAGITLPLVRDFESVSFTLRKV